MGISSRRHRRPRGGNGKDGRICQLETLEPRILLDGTDWGDAPRPYPTLMMDNGAHHDVLNDFLLGTDIDDESNGQPSTSADRDDLMNVDDEDGVTFTSLLVLGRTATVDVEATTHFHHAALDAWIDFDGDGSWQGMEQIFHAEPLSHGVNPLSFVVPTWSLAGETFARFRLSYDGGLTPEGYGGDGEVEDYMVRLEPTPETDFGDAPDPLYPTLLASDGARHDVIAGMYLGAGVEGDPDGQPTYWADGDDYADGTDDEDGVTFVTPLTIGQTATIDVVASQRGFVDAWIDWDADGDWNDPGDQILAAAAVTAGSNTFHVPVPIMAANGFTYARFRYSSQGGLAFTGPATEGEVEDYRVKVELDRELFKWQQFPDRTTVDNVYYGWNEPSIYEGSQIAADDWLCTSADPVTEITWWGSFLGYTGTDASAVMPDAFELGIWTDVPAGADQPFSHPGQVIWNQFESSQEIQVEWAGWDYDPRIGAMEACFKFTAVLDPTEYFYQEAGENIYWLSVDAQYTTVVPHHVFGWKTRPYENLDAAVRIFQPNAAPVGALYGAGEPIYFPDDAQWWDLAFEIVSDPEPTVLQKWEQRPDLSPNGLDVLDGPILYPTGESWNKYLADDFLCTASGEITTIDIWGSFLNDFQEPGMPHLFNLAIYDDLPASQNPDGYSEPLQPLWEWYGRATDGILFEEAQEGFYDPNIDEIIGSDTQVWQYTFDFDPGEGFYQEEGKIYWLAVNHSMDLNADGQIDMQDRSILVDGWAFGWKTSPDHWNDDAVFTDVQPEPTGIVPPPSGPWGEMHYPQEHELAGQSIDLSFRLTTISDPDPFVKWSQQPAVYEDGPYYNGWDEPSIYGNEQIVADDFLCEDATPITDVHWWGSFLGWTLEDPMPVMPEQFHVALWTDTPAGVVNPWSSPDICEYEVIVPADRIDWEFVGWDIDPRDPAAPPEATFKFNYDLPEEMWYFQPHGDNVFWVSIAGMYPDIMPEHPFGWKTTTDGWNDAAVRITDPTSPSPGTPFTQGEPIYYPAGDPTAPWDMAFELTTEDVWDFGDAPDPLYPTLIANNGPRHRYTPGFHLGNRVDYEANGLPTAKADGDDLMNVDDEDGVTFTSPLMAGQPGTVDVTASAAGFLDAWIDFNADGDWADPGEQIAASVALSPGVNKLTFGVPGIPTPNVSFARFRFSSAGGLSPVGPAADGEVEDHRIRVSPAPGIPDLVPICDSGYSNSDDITYLNNSSPSTALQFVVPGTVTGALVKLYDGSTVIASAVATGPSTVLTTDGSTAWADGSHNIHATMAAPGMWESAPSGALSVSVDTASPAVLSVGRNGGAPNTPDQLNMLSFQFDDDVHLSLQVNDLSFYDRTNGAPFALPAGTWFTYNFPVDTAVWFFPSQVPPACYTATLGGLQIEDVAGNLLDGGSGAGTDFDHNFYQAIPGDANLDRKVSLADLSSLAAHWNQTPANWDEGDFSHDNKVSLADLSTLAGHWGQDVTAPPVVAAVFPDADGQPRSAAAPPADDGDRQMDALTGTQAPAGDGVQIRKQDRDGYPDTLPEAPRLRVQTLAQHYGRTGSAELTAFAGFGSADDGMDIRPAELEGVEDILTLAAAQ